MGVHYLETIHNVRFVLKTIKTSECITLKLYGVRQKATPLHALTSGILWSRAPPHWVNHVVGSLWLYLARLLPYSEGRTQDLWHMFPQYGPLGVVSS